MLYMLRMHVTKFMEFMTSMHVKGFQKTHLSEQGDACKKIFTGPDPDCKCRTHSALLGHIGYAASDDQCVHWAQAANNLYSMLPTKKRGSSCSPFENEYL